MSKSRGRNRPKPDHRQQRKTASSDGVWIWGIHPVEAALANPRREVLELLATRNAASRLPAGSPAPELVAPDVLSQKLAPGAVHQGLAIRCKPLEPVAIEDVVEAGAQRLVIADQITDPHNLGAIFRSCAAFGAEALVLQTRNTPPITGTVAKSAAGALDLVAECRVVNLSRTLEFLAESGFHTIGLSGEGMRTIEQAISGAPRIALVLGAEGAGLRPGVARACAEIAHIPIDSRMESLNVSNAAAIALYIAQQAQGSSDA